MSADKGKYAPRFARLRAYAIDVVIIIPQNSRPRDGPVLGAYLYMCYNLLLSRDCETEGVLCGVELDMSPG